MSQRDHASCLEAFERFLDSSLSSVICEGLQSIRSQADDITQADTVSNLSAAEVTKQLLREVKSWTQVLLEEETRRIEVVVPYLQKLLTALFVMKIKILSCINVRKNEEEFPLSIPANTTFIHQVYIQCARLLLDNPRVIDDMNAVEIQPLVTEGIRRACDACIKWNDFLVWGLGGVTVSDMVSSMNEGEPDNDNSEPQDEQDANDGMNVEDTGEEESNDMDMSPSNDESNDMEGLMNDDKMSIENEEGASEPDDAQSLDSRSVSDGGGNGNDDTASQENVHATKPPGDTSPGDTSPGDTRQTMAFF